MSQSLSPIPSRKAVQPSRRRHLDQRKIDQIRQLLAEGYRQAEVARLVGVSASTVNRVLERDRHQAIAKELHTLKQLVDQLLAERETQTRIMRQLLDLRHDQPR